MGIYIAARGNEYFLKEEQLLQSKTNNLGKDAANNAYSKNPPLDIGIK